MIHPFHPGSRSTLGLGMFYGEDREFDWQAFDTIWRTCLEDFRDDVGIVLKGS